MAREVAVAVAIAMAAADVPAARATVSGTLTDTLPSGAFRGRSVSR